VDTFLKGLKQIQGGKMNEYLEYDDYQSYEPVFAEGMDKAFKLDGEICVDVGAVHHSIKNFISNNANNLLKDFIQKEVIKCLQSSYESKAQWKEMLKEVMSEKMDKKYPDVVENKVNEMVEEIKKHQFKSGSYRHKVFETINQKAMKKVDDYIEGELAESVKQSKDYIEQFAKNYFADNLFRAMGMMDKMIPQVDVKK